MPKGIPDSMIQRRDTYSWQAAPKSSRVVASFSQRLLRFMRSLARDDSRLSLPISCSMVSNLRQYALGSRLA